MNVVVDINHPAHIHFFKNFIVKMRARGHEVLITASKKEMAYDLLNNYNLEYSALGSYGTSLKEKFFNLWKLDIKMYRSVKAFRPDIFVGLGSIRAAHVSKLMKKPCIIFTDTEHSKEQYLLYAPFADAILTPSCFKRDLGEKQIRYNGHHELSYLHPEYFKPNPSVLSELGLNKKDIFTIIRFVSWDASHDIGQHGINDKFKLIKELEKYGDVFISSEGILSNKFKKYKLEIAPEKIHDLLYYATQYMGEGATMATESAILGTPAIYISSLVGSMGNFIELEQQYGLLYAYNDTGKAMDKSIELIKRKNIKTEWRQKRELYLKDKIDVTSFAVWFVENYPESFKSMKIINNRP